jgi:hypothetical protein
MTGSRWENEPGSSARCVWYVGYGSNLCEERFLCYILGGQFKWGGRKTEGCRDKTPPRANESIIIPFSLYFAKKSKCWQDGAVAFISALEEQDPANYTYARMWKITAEQFECVWKQEGKGWYNEYMPLGQHADGTPIVTITSRELLDVNKPSEQYIRTVTLGLKETYNLDDAHIVEYLAKHQQLRLL